MLISDSVMPLIAQHSNNAPFTVWPEQALQGTHNAAQDRLHVRMGKRTFDYCRSQACKTG